MDWRAEYKGMKYKEKRKKALELFGNRCFFYKLRKCHGNSLVFHKKDGGHHPNNVCHWVLRNPNDFVVMCSPCHNSVHWVMEVLGLSWEQILSYLDK